MKKMIEFYADRRLSVGILKTGLALVVGVALGSAFWMASTPMAHGQGKLTPVEMIQSKLPQGKTIATASDTQLLEAVCKAVRQWPKQAGLIVRTASGARKSLRTDILCTSIRCLREGHALDCVWVADVVREWIKAEPSEANRLVEVVMECASECRDLLQNLGPGVGEGNFGNPPINVNPPPGSVGGGAGGNVCIVCHNGQEIQVACSDLDNYLSGHPGDSTGPCQPTPVTNR